VKIRNMKRYWDIIRLYVRHGRRHIHGEESRPLLTPASTNGHGSADDREAAKALAEDLERLGPTYVKFGQLLSTRPDLLPQPYLDELARFQDNVKPFPYEQVDQIVREELGRPTLESFLEFDPVPLAAASLGQVHRARLPDGTLVAVKVQRPGVRERIAEDFEAFLKLAGFTEKHTAFGRRYSVASIVDQFRKTLQQELDYTVEANNLRVLGENLKEFDKILVPQPVDEYTTSRVLTMSYIRGEKIDSFAPLKESCANGRELAEQLFKAYLQQIFVDGFLHADPHPGNVFLTDDGRIALLDLGMVTRITPGMQDKLLHLVLAISEGRGEEAAEFAIGIGEPREDFDRARFTRIVSDLVAMNQNVKVGTLEVGRIVLDITRGGAETGITPPPELATAGQALMKLDQVGRILCPDFDPNATVRRYSAEITQRRLKNSVTTNSLLNMVLELKDFAEKLPSRANRILDAVAKNDFKLHVDAVDEQQLMEGVQKIANRITLGLVLAALIVGAALLTRVQTSFQLFGYPGLAMLFFLGAAAGVVTLAVQILFRDVPHKRKLYRR
jgi:ubiquinone biosynthesis protein